MKSINNDNGINNGVNPKEAENRLDEFIRKNPCSRNRKKALYLGLYEALEMSKEELLALQAKVAKSKKWAIIAVVMDPMNLEYVSQMEKNNLKIVKFCIECNPFSVQYASAELKSYYYIAHYAILKGAQSVYTKAEMIQLIRRAFGREDTDFTEELLTYLSADDLIEDKDLFFTLLHSSLPYYWKTSVDALVKKMRNPKILVDFLKEDEGYHWKDLLFFICNNPFGDDMISLLADKDVRLELWKCAINTVMKKFDYEANVDLLTVVLVNTASLILKDGEEEIDKARKILEDCIGKDYKKNKDVLFSLFG